MAPCRLHEKNPTAEPWKPPEHLRFSSPSVGGRCLWLAGSRSSSSAAWWTSDFTGRGEGEIAGAQWWLRSEHDWISDFKSKGSRNKNRFLQRSRCFWFSPFCEGPFGAGGEDPNSSGAFAGTFHEHFFLFQPLGWIFMSPRADDSRDPGDYEHLGGKRSLGGRSWCLFFSHFSKNVFFCFLFQFF